jgi:hypothetical protein
MIVLALVLKRVEVFHGLRLVVYAVMLTILYLIATYLLHRQYWCVFTVLLGISCVASTSFVIYCYQKAGGPTADYIAKLERYATIPRGDERYRFNTTSNIVTLPSDLPGLSSFNSTVANSIRRFDKSFDFKPNNHRMNKNSYAGLVELLGGRYEITSDGVKERAVCPIGFAARNYLTKDELASSQLEKRGLLLLNAVTVDDAALVSDLKHLKIDEINDDSIKNAVDDCNKHAISSLASKPYGYEALTNYKRDEWVYFSIPNELGWAITIDSVAVAPLESNGMMLIRIPKGRHEISFRFRSPGYIAGMIITLIAWTGFGGYATIQSRLRKLKKTGVPPKSKLSRKRRSR